jgi:hypothetical protein
MCIDILMAVQGMLGNGYSSLQLAGLFMVSLLVMTTGASLFVVYDRRYYSKTLKSSLIHTIAYAIAVSALSTLSFYSIYSFNQNALGAQLHAAENLSLMFGVLRIAVFFASAPVIAYGLNQFCSRRQGNP